MRPELQGHEVREHSARVRLACLGALCPWLRAPVPDWFHLGFQGPRGIRPGVDAAVWQGGSCVAQ